MVHVKSDFETFVPVAEGIRLFVKSIGSGSTVVVPLACWCEEFQALANRRRVVLYDPRGRGRSTAVDLERISFASDLEDLEKLQRWLDLPQVALIGWSYFGGVVARYTMDHPERVSRLVLIGGMPVRAGAFLDRVQQEQARRLSEVAPALTGSANSESGSPQALDELWDAFVMTRSGVKPPWPGMISKPFQYANEQPAAFFPLVERAMRSIGDYDWRGDAGHLRMPVLVIEGSEDILPREAASEWLQALGNGRALILEGIGHFPSLESPACLFRALDEFLTPGPASAHEAPVL